AWAAEESGVNQRSAISRELCHKSIAVPTRAKIGVLRWKACGVRSPNDVCASRLIYGDRVSDVEVRGAQVSGVDQRISVDTQLRDERVSVRLISLKSSLRRIIRGVGFA